MINLKLLIEFETDRQDLIIRLSTTGFFCVIPYRSPFLDVRDVKNVTT